MGVLRISFLIVFTCSVLSLRVEAKCDDLGYSLKLLRFPYSMSRWNSATFAFESFTVISEEPCADCRFTCKLDNSNTSECDDKKVTYGGLLDGDHSFNVCSNGSQGVGCDYYNWKIDTVPPQATLTSSTPITNALNFTVNISFSEPCSGGGGFRCSSVDDCNLLVYGAGQVIPSSLRILRPNLTYSVLVSLNWSSPYGRLTLVMDKVFCSDGAGNRFMQTARSNLTVYYDKISDFAHMKTQIPEKTVQLSGQNRTVRATNDSNNLKFHLFFPQPVLNSSVEILDSLNINIGRLVPIPGDTLGNRRFDFMVVNQTSWAVITITFNSNGILTREGTTASPLAPITFLYDAERPVVRVTSPHRTREQIIPISIEFTEPVFSFNESNIKVSGGHLQSNIKVSGGHLQRLRSSFQENNWRIYNLEIKAESEFVSVQVPENVTADVAGNNNIASDFSRVWHYTTPTVSRVVSTTATASIVATAFASGLLSISTASLQSSGFFQNPSASLTSEPSRNLFRMAGHIQVAALLRWVASELPVEYYELARGIQWIIPYFSLPWEAGHVQPIVGGSNPSSSAQTIFTRTVGSHIGGPLAFEDYKLYFGVQEYKTKNPCIDDSQNATRQNATGQNANGWRDFGRNMFWLAVIGGSLILLHVLLLLILKSKKKNNQNQNNYSALSFPRFEISLLNLALPCICQASANVIKGGTPSGIAIGVVLLILVAFALLALLLFLYGYITFGKLLQYEEDNPKGQNDNWYQALVRVTVGLEKRGAKWTPEDSIQLILYGPVFEDLRGPPKDDHNIASDDKTKDVEEPSIQKYFGILRIYYTLLESIRRALFGIFAGALEKCSIIPTITLSCITCFQLFFLVLMKPCISRGVQFVEIISLSTEVAQLASNAVFLRRKSLGKKATGFGIFTVMLFLVGLVAQMVNELHALYSQTKRLDQTHGSFFSGLKVASLGLVNIILKT